MESLINVKAEQSVLGSILLNNSCINEAETLNIEDFSSPAHKNIFEAMKILNQKKSVIDIITLPEELRTKNLLEISGGISYITSLATTTPSPSSIRYYVDIVKDLSKKRIVVAEAYKVINSLENGKELDSVLGAFETNTKFEDINDNEGIFLTDIMANILDKLESKAETRIKTGIRAIDKRTNGIGKGELVTIGATSGGGKTSLALKIAREAYRQGKKILIISREMSKEQVGERLLLNECGISKAEYDTRDFSECYWQKIIHGMQKLSTTNFAIDDKVSTIQGILTKVREFKPDLLIVDYVQLISPDNDRESRERQVAKFSRELKNITLDFNIPVIQLTQLSDKGNDNRPHGETYTRESRAIYHDSNIVIYLYHVKNEKEIKRAYDRLEKFKQADGTFEDIVNTVNHYLEKKNTKLIEIIVDKNRAGTTGSDYHWFTGKDLMYTPIN